MNTSILEDLQSRLQQTPARAEQASQFPGPRLLKRTQPLPMTGFFHAVTGQRLVLPPDEALAYLRLGSDFFNDLQPVGVRETHLVQRILDITWRLHRATAMENNVIETETLRHAQPHKDARSEAVAAQAAAIRNDCENTGALDTLNRYDARLTRTLRQTSDELERLQSIREAKGKPGFVEEECKALLWYEAMIRQYTEQPATSTSTIETSKLGRSLCTRTISAPKGGVKTSRPLHKHAGSAG